MEKTSQWKRAYEFDASAANKQQSCWTPSIDRAYLISSKDNLHAVHGRISQHVQSDRVAVCICAD